MTRNSMGQFMAALRKANGMTQQEVADRLSVSNKAISRWERDECAPDITLIPALAELYGVTCDELLRGERIFSKETTGEQNESKPQKKADKQIRALVNRTRSGFKTMLWIAMALAAVGLVCMFGISYGFYRPVIGFAVMMLFVLAAGVLTAVAVGKLKEAKTENELFEEADASLLAKVDEELGTYSFVSFFLIISVICLSLPLVLVQSKVVVGVLILRNYIPFFAGIVLGAVLLFCLAKEPYCLWITGQARKEKRKVAPKVRILNRIQLVCIGVFTLWAFSMPYIGASELVEESELTQMVGSGMAGGLPLLLLLVPFALCLFIKAETKEDRARQMFYGLRNFLLLPAAVLLSMSHRVIYYSTNGSESFRKLERWDAKYIVFALAWVVLVVVLAKCAQKKLFVSETNRGEE